MYLYYIFGKSTTSLRDVVRDVVLFPFLFTPIYTMGPPPKPYLTQSTMTVVLEKVLYCFAM